MKMDVHDWQRLYEETVEKFRAAFDELKDAVDRVTLACMVSDEEHLQELGSFLSDARDSAEMEIANVISLGEVMTML